MRVWILSDEGKESSRLFGVVEPERLRSFQACGELTRTLWGPDGWGSHDLQIQSVREGGRFRETALIAENGDVLQVLGRFPRPVEGQARDDGLMVEMPTDLIALCDPSTTAVKDAKVHWADFLRLLHKGVQWSVRSGEMFTVEIGGWLSGTRGIPRCDFVVIADDGEPWIMMVAAPAPVGSVAWEHVIVPGQPAALLKVQAVEEMLELAPKILLDAVGRWDVHPTDLAFTFSRRRETASSAS